MELLTGLCARAVTSTTRERRRVALKGDSPHDNLARTTYWANLGNLHTSTSEMVLVMGRLLAIFYEVNKTLFFHSLHLAPVLIFNVSEWDDVRI